MNLARALVVVVAACGRPVAPAPAPPPAPDAALVARVDAYLAPYVEMRDFAGVVLIARDDRVLLSRRYGDAPGGAYLVGSLAKTVTGAAIERAMADGTLGLDDPIGRHVAGLPYGDRVTIRQLLDHRAGVPDYYGFPEFAARHRDDLSLAALVALIASKPLDFPPGSDERYSNSGYALLAAAIEHASGRRYADFVVGELFAPLHMTRSGDVTAGAPPTLVAGRDPSFPPELVQPAASIGRGWLAGNGGFYTTADDLRIWLAAARRRAQPYGWGVHDHHGHRVVEQDGRLPGYAAYAGVARDDGVAVIVLSNIQAQVVATIGVELAELARGHAVAPPARRPVAAADAGPVAAFAGRYQVAPGFELTIAATPRGLTLAGPDGIALPLDRTGATSFYFRPLQVAIGFLGDGAALTWNGDAFPRVTPAR